MTLQNSHIGSARFQAAPDFRQPRRVSHRRNDRSPVSGFFSTPTIAQTLAALHAARGTLLAAHTMTEGSLLTVLKPADFQPCALLAKRTAFLTSANP